MRWRWWASETYTSTSAPIQYAAVRAFRGGPKIEAYLADCRRVLTALGGWCAKSLQDAGAHLADPIGGFYLFPDFEALREPLAARGIETNEQLCHQLLEDTGVAILPGSQFGRPPTELTVRLAYVDFDGGAANAALGDEPADEAFVREHCPRVVEAITRMCAWLQKA